MLRRLIVGYNHSFRFLMKFNRNCSASGMFVSNCVPCFMEMWRKYIYGQGSQKLYNWPKILSPPHYRNGVHHTVEIICLYCGELRDVSENI